MESRDYSINACWMKCIKERGERGQPWTQTVISCLKHSHIHMPTIQLYASTKTPSIHVHVPSHMHTQRMDNPMQTLHIHICVHKCKEKQKTKNLYSHHHISTCMDNTETTHRSHTSITTQTHKYKCVHTHRQHTHINNYLPTHEHTHTP